MFMNESHLCNRNSNRNSMMTMKELRALLNAINVHCSHQESEYRCYLIVILL